MGTKRYTCLSWEQTHYYHLIASRRFFLQYKHCNVVVFFCIRNSVSCWIVTPAKKGLRNLCSAGSPLIRNLISSRSLYHRRHVDLSFNNEEDSGVDCRSYCYLSHLSQCIIPVFTVSFLLFTPVLFRRHVKTSTSASPLFAPANQLISSLHASMGVQEGICARHQLLRCFHEELKLLSLSTKKNK